MCKCRSAITPAIAFQHGWQAELSRSSVSSYGVWLWSHFHAGHNCTKTRLCSLLQRCLIFNGEESKWCCFFSAHYFLPREGRTKKCTEIAQKQTKTVCPVVSPAKTWTHIASVCVCVGVWMRVRSEVRGSVRQDRFWHSGNFTFFIAATGRCWWKWPSDLGKNVKNSPQMPTLFSEAQSLRTHIL